MSQTHVTGPEVYVASLCKRQMRDGPRCMIVSDTLTIQSDARHITMSIHNRSWLSCLRNIIKLVRLCRQEKIDLIHAHSRAASWLANIAPNCNWPRQNEHEMFQISRHLARSSVERLV
ncbi:MAG: glycosyltransferase [Proteobacteria bacterium]|nr:glycosyltransferase [Pseudomonadota bacterium]